MMFRCWFQELIHLGNMEDIYNDVTCDIFDITLLSLSDIAKWIV